MVCEKTNIKYGYWLVLFIAAIVVNPCIQAMEGYNPKESEQASYKEQQQKLNQEIEMRTKEQAKREKNLQGLQDSLERQQEYIKDLREKQTKASKAAVRSKIEQQLSDAQVKQEALEKQIGSEESAVATIKESLPELQRQRQALEAQLAPQRQPAQSTSQQKQVSDISISIKLGNVEQTATQLAEVVSYPDFQASVKTADRSFLQKLSDHVKKVIENIQTAIQAVKDKLSDLADALKQARAKKDTTQVQALQENQTVLQEHIKTLAARTKKNNATFRRLALVTVDRSLPVIRTEPAEQAAIDLEQILNDLDEIFSTEQTIPKDELPSAISEVASLKQMAQDLFNQVSVEESDWNTYLKRAALFDPTVKDPETKFLRDRYHNFGSENFSSVLSAPQIKEVIKADGNLAILGLPEVTVPDITPNVDPQIAEAQILNVLSLHAADFFGLDIAKLPSYSQDEAQKAIDTTRKKLTALSGFQGDTDISKLFRNMQFMIRTPAIREEYYVYVLLFENPSAGDKAFHQYITLPVSMEQATDEFFENKLMELGTTKQALDTIVDKATEQLSALKSTKPS